MKKKYEKPMILFENFAMSTNIAAECAIKDVPATYGECGIDLPGLGVVFVTGIQACDNGFAIPDIDDDPTIIDAKFDKFCYHIPQQNSNLFNS